MELLQLTYFVELAKREHLNQTASAMIVSPSAISSSISRLEKELGVRLFDRVGRNIQLNDYGREYLKYVQRALSEIDSGGRKLLDMTGKQDNRLIVATPNPYVWQDTMSVFRHNNPNISMKHIFFDPVSSNSPIPPDNTDVVIASPGAFSHRDWQSALLFSDNIVLAVPPGHPFATRDCISLIEAKDEWFVSLSDSSFSRCCTELCIEAGFEPKSRVECDYMLRPKIVLSENMVCLTTYNGKYAGVFSGIPLIPLSDPGAVREQAVFWKRSSYIPQAIQLFIDFILSKYGKCGNMKDQR